MSTDLHRRLRELEAEVVALRAAIDGTPQPVTSRRELLLVAAAGVAGVATGALGASRPAAAATNDPMVLGVTNTADAVTVLVNNAPFPNLNAPGPIALRLESPGGHLQFIGAPGDATRGANYPDGTMTYNSSDGLRLWFSDSVTRIVSRSTMPLHPLPQPLRVYDSRLPATISSPNGPVNAGQSRTVNLGFDQHGNSTELSLLAYSGAFVNVTVVNTVGSGYVAVRSPAVAPPSTSTVNWSSSSQIVANMAMTRLSEGSLEIYCGAGSTDVVVDVLAMLG